MEIMEKENKEMENVMKKKPYIAPDIKVVKIEQENIMTQSWRVYDGNGNLDDKGTVIEGDLPGTNTNPAKGANPFSGDWEL